MKPFSFSTSQFRFPCIPWFSTRKLLSWPQIFVLGKAILMARGKRKPGGGRFGLLIRGRGRGRMLIWQLTREAKSHSTFQSSNTLFAYVAALQGFFVGTFLDRVICLF